MADTLAFPHRLTDAASDGFGVGLWRSSDPNSGQSLWLERTPGGFLAALAEHGALVVAGYWREDADQPGTSPDFIFERAWGPMAPRMSTAGPNLSLVGQRILDIMCSLSLGLNIRRSACYADSQMGLTPWRNIASARAAACATPPLDLAHNFLCLDAPPPSKTSPVGNGPG